jgi:hypothetical protein
VLLSAGGVVGVVVWRRAWRRCRRVVWCVVVDVVPVALGGVVPGGADWVPVASGTEGAGAPGVLVRPITPVPPAGVPWPLLGAVVLGTPPGGALVACAQLASTPNEVAINVASTVDANWRRFNDIMHISQLG